MTTRIELRIPGKPRGKGRHRVDTRGRRPRQYTPAATEAYEKLIQDEWQAAGRRSLGRGAVAGIILAVHARPKGHRLKDGTLSAGGRREWKPLLKPDVDNLAKVVCDALNGLAFHDDVQVAPLTVDRRWAEPGEEEHIEVALWSHRGPPLGGPRCDADCSE